MTRHRVEGSGNAMMANVISCCTKCSVNEVVVHFFYFRIYGVFVFLLVNFVVFFVMKLIHPVITEMFRSKCYKHEVKVMKIFNYQRLFLFV